MSWRIHKTFNFEYGHRVWVQKLNPEFSLDALCACRHLHGHSGKVIIHLSGEELDPITSMITDFKHLNFMRKFFDEVIDHKFILDIHDPLARDLIKNRPLVPILVPGTEHTAGWCLNLEDVEPGTPDYEYLEGFFIVDFVPTSEKLSEWVWQIVQHKMYRLGVVVDQIEWHETPRSCAIYEISSAQRQILQGIAAGAKDIAEGRWFTHEEVKARLSKFMGSVSGIQED